MRTEILPKKTFKILRPRADARKTFENRAHEIALKICKQIFRIVNVGNVSGSSTLPSDGRLIRIWTEPADQRKVKAPQWNSLQSVGRKMAANSHPAANLANLDLSEFRIIYPLYINSNRTQQQGRRIGKEKAVPDPNVQEIEQVLSKINGARIIVEFDKRHPREIFVEQAQFLGRYRLQSFWSIWSFWFIILIIISLTAQSSNRAVLV